MADPTPTNLGQRKDLDEVEAQRRRQRVCKTPGCKTKLSSANAKEYCYACYEGRTMASRLNPPIRKKEADTD